MEKTDLVIGFNSIGFDNNLVAASGIIIPPEKNYDILVEVWKGAGLGEVFKYPSHVGFGLDAICKATLGWKKSGNGAFAPVQWQRGEIGSVIDYCLNDVNLTMKLFNHINLFGRVNDPRNMGQEIKVQKPEAF